MTLMDAPTHAGTMPSQPPPRSPSSRTWWLLAAAATAAVVLAVLFTFATATIIHSVRHPTPTHPTATTPPTAGTPTASGGNSSPDAVTLTDADRNWCETYGASNDKLADEAKAAGVTRHLEAPHLPMTDWTPEQTQSNKKYARYLQGIIDRQSDLRASASNPVIHSLIKMELENMSLLVGKIDAGTYRPDDYKYDIAYGFADNALLAGCKEFHR